MRFAMRPNAKDLCEWVLRVFLISGNVALRRDQKEGMYRTLVKPEWETIQTQFVPYYSWCNRGQSEMTVWMPILWK